MGRIGCLLFIVILLVIGWDQWRIEQMRGEVRAISGKFNVQKPAKPGTKLDMVTSLAEAERHTKLAKTLLKQKKTAQAQAELDKALHSLRSANNVSQDIVGDAAQFMGKARDNAVRVFQKAWTDISKEAKQKKVDVTK